MNNRSVAKHIVFSIIGFALFAFGIILMRLYPDAEGILLTLPYICVGVGAGVFGGNFGAAIANHALSKNPKAAKQKENEIKDERNRTISDRAKAKAYDAMTYVYAAILLAFALMQVDMFVVLTLVAVYLFVIFTNVYYLAKYHKEM